MSISVGALFVLVVFAVWRAVPCGAQQGARDNGLASLLQEDQALRSLLLEQLRLQDEEEARGRQRLAELEAGTRRLEEEVQRLEAAVQRGRSAAKEVAAAVVTLQDVRDNAAAAAKAAAVRSAHEASQRLCEALVAGRGELQPLCTGASLQSEEDALHVLRWLDSEQRRPPPKLWVLLVKLGAVWSTLVLFCFALLEDSLLHLLHDDSLLYPLRRRPHCFKEE